MPPASEKMSVVKEILRKVVLGMSRPCLGPSTEFGDKQRHGQMFQRPVPSTLLVL